MEKIEQYFTSSDKITHLRTVTWMPENDVKGVIVFEPKVILSPATAFSLNSKVNSNLALVLSIVLIPNIQNEGFAIPPNVISKYFVSSSSMISTLKSLDNTNSKFASFVFTLYTLSSTVFLGPNE